MRPIYTLTAVVAALLACSSEGPAPVALPAFTIADSSLTARPGKTQYTERLVLGAPADTTALRALLESRLAFAREFSSEWHPSPTVITSYVFAPEADTSGADWVAMLSVTPIGPEPSFTFNRAAIAYGLAPPDDRFGMTVAERQGLYRDLVATEQRARCEAEVEAPLESPSGDVTLERMKANVQLQDRLREQYEGELLRERAVTAAIADSVSIEGLTAQWVQPTAPCDD